jgi:type III pantothenate kinase
MSERWLLIDIGNTHTRFAVATAQRIGSRRARVPTRSLNDSVLANVVKRFRFDRAVLCSVVPRATRVVRGNFGDALLEVSARCILGFSLAGYRNPSTIGADRLANLAGAVAARAVAFPLVAVDAGTATTFDVLDAKGRFVGGVIAPGPAAFTDYLHARGAQLPVVRANPRKPTNILGRSTQAAIAAAAVHGFRGMAKEILAKIQGALKTKTLHVVLAGGAADWLGTLPGDAVRRDPDLTFRGMLAIARRNA